MSQVKIQEFIISEVTVSQLACVKKGNTIKARIERCKAKWVQFMVDRGYTVANAEVVFKDAYDMAILELNAA